MKMFSEVFCFLSASVLYIGILTAENPSTYLYEPDDTLELYSESSLENSYAAFCAKGGTFVMLDEGSTYAVMPGDVVFPSCSGGNNRSQTLWNLLRPYAGEITLMPPHATRYGFDPYNGLENWQRTSHSQKNDEFALWAGIPKSQKFGWDLFGKWLPQTNVPTDVIQEMSEYYTTHYYNPESLAGSRRIYITFAQNVHVHFYRLSQTNASLENVVLVCFPLEDLIHGPKSEWHTYPRSEKCYRKFSQILQSRLDCSQL